MDDQHTHHYAPPRESLVGLLIEWQTGELTPWDVVSRAEAIQEVLWDGLFVVPEVDKRDPCSINRAVLELLASAHVSYVLPEDISVMLHFLATAPGEELAAWNAFDGYWETIDWQVREQSVHALYYSSPSSP